MKRIKIFWLFLILAFLPFPAGAWGVLGHRIVGGIADHHLSGKARSGIRKLLGNESVAMTSNWADFVKSDKQYHYLSPWHYINLPDSSNREALTKHLSNDTTTNLYVKLNFLIRALKAGRLEKDTNVLYLKLLIHLVGDAHQPMHASLLKNRGGNNIHLYWFNNPTNLHRLWDEQLIEFQQLSYTEHVNAINFATPSQVKNWQGDAVSDWIIESYQLSQNLYEEINPGDKLGFEYNYHHVAMMNEQLLKGGIRLAGVLNEIFG